MIHRNSVTDQVRRIDPECRIFCRWLLGLYLIALLLPAIYESPYCPHWPGGTQTPWLLGIECLVDGAILLGVSLYFLAPEVPLFPWTANLLFYVGLYCLRSGRSLAAYRFGVAATLTAFTTILYWPHYTFVDRTAWSALGPGYFVWQSCMILLALRAFITVSQKCRSVDALSTPQSSIAL